MRDYLKVGDRVYIKRKLYRYPPGEPTDILIWGTIVKTRMRKRKTGHYFWPSSRKRTNYGESPGMTQYMIKWDNPKYFKEPNAWWSSQGLKRYG